MLKYVILLAWVLLPAVSGCSGKASTSEDLAKKSQVQQDLQADSSDDIPAREKQPSQLTRDDIESADVSILFVGNSHSAPLPLMLNQIIERESPEKKSLTYRAISYGFLADHAKRKSTTDLIEKGAWDFVVLQAQKYSTTGKRTYPTDGAKELAKLAQSGGSQVLMYPEWSRRDVPDEYARIKAIHDSIAQEVNCRVAPIGEAWVAAHEDQPDLELYAIDGNHASEFGSYLNACVFYAIATGKSPERATAENESEKDSVKRMLERSAWRAVEKSGVLKRENESGDR